MPKGMNNQQIYDMKKFKNSVNKINTNLSQAQEIS